MNQEIGKGGVLGYKAGENVARNLGDPRRPAKNQVFAPPLSVLTEDLS